MANEISAPSQSGETIYVLLQNQSGKFWNTADLSFDTYATVDRGDYDVALIEQGTASGIYLASFPTDITTAGTYVYYAYRRAGATPAETDTLVATGEIDWNGTTVAIQGVSGSQTGSEWREYVLRGGFKRTDKDTEIYEATTDAIQWLRRKSGFDEAHEDKTTTDTISTLGDFRIDVESDLGLILNVIIQDGDTSTVLKQRTKAQFDRLYPDIYNTNDRGYPEHFTIYKGQIYIGPVPDQTSYVYRVGYSKRAGTVTSSTTAVPFTNLYRDILRDAVYARLYEGLDEFDKAQWYYQKATNGYDEIVSRENNIQGKGYFTVKCQ